MESVHLRPTLQPVLCDFFVLFLSFSIVTQLSNALFQLYNIVDLLEQLLRSGQDQKEDQMARIILQCRERRDSWRHLKFTIEEFFLVECPKLYLMLLALTSVTDSGKATNLVIFVIFFFLYVTVQWVRDESLWSGNRKALIPGLDSPLDLIIQKHLWFKKLIDTVTYIIGIICLINLAIINWKQLLNSLNG